MEAKIDTLENCIGEKTRVLEETFSEIEKKIEETQKSVDDENIKIMEIRLDILEKRRLGSDFCDFFEMEFKSGSEKNRKERICM